MTPRKFRKKPVVIEAMQWDGHYPPFREWLGGDAVHMYGSSVMLLSPNTWTLTVLMGDWVIKTANGDVSVCKPDLFETTYEEAE